MKPFSFFLILASILSTSIHASTAEIALLRFRPSQKSLLLGDPSRWVKSPASAALKFQEQLKTIGSATILFRTNQVLSSTATNSIKILESYPLRAAGKDEPLGTVIALEVQLDVVFIPSNNSSALAWTGFVRWSPEMLDYLAGSPAAFLQPFTGTSTSHVVTNKTSLNRSLLDLCKTVTYSSPSSPIIELPVARTATLEGSLIPSPNVPILQATVSEHGGQNAQALVLFIKLNP